MTPRQTLGFKDTEQFLEGLLGTDMHAKRILSLANATLERGNGDRLIPTDRTTDPGRSVYPIEE